MMRSKKLNMNLIEARWSSLTHKVCRLIFSSASVFPSRSLGNPSFGSWLWMGCELCPETKPVFGEKDWKTEVEFCVSQRPSSTESALPVFEVIFFARYGPLFPCVWKTDTFVQLRIPIMGTWSFKTNTRASSETSKSWVQCQRVFFIFDFSVDFWSLKFLDECKVIKRSVKN
jgi:hypothetical protein